MRLFVGLAIAVCASVPASAEERPFGNVEGYQVLQDGENVRCALHFTFPDAGTGETLIRLVADMNDATPNQFFIIKPGKSASIHDVPMTFRFSPGEPVTAPGRTFATASAAGYVADVPNTFLVALARSSRLQVEADGRVVERLVLDNSARGMDLFSRCLDAFLDAE